MDPLTISPSWVEHCNQLIPGFGFVEFDKVDNDSQPQDEFVQVTLENIRKVLALPYGPFASLLAFNSDLEKFLDSFLEHRERLSTKSHLIPLDIAVFSLFFKFVADVPPGLRFSAGTKTSSIVGLNVLSSARLFLLCALFVDNSAQNSPMRDVVEIWTSQNKGFDKDIVRFVQLLSGDKSKQNERSAEALCGLMHVLPILRNEIIKALGGIRGSHLDGFKTLQAWYARARSASEKGHLLRVLYLMISRINQEGIESLLEYSTELNEDEKTFFADLISQSDFLEQFKSRGAALKIDTARLDYTCTIMLSFTPSTDRGDPYFDEHHISYAEAELSGESTKLTQGEGEEAKFEEGYGESEDNPVEQLKEIAPHLGRYFCQKLLEACNGNLERAVAAVLEGTLPSQVANLDFSLEEEPKPKEEPKSKQVVLGKQTISASSTDEDVSKQQKGLQSKLTAFYNRYDDEYDDTLDGGGRLVVDTGAKMLEEDDPEESGEGGDEARDAKVSARPFKLQPRNLMDPTSSTKANRASDGGRKRPQNERQQEGKPTHDPRAMVAPVERGFSVVDVNGERRNAAGKRVNEEVLMRPNLNRTRTAPADTQRVKPQQEQQARALTKEEQAERVKRERARKDRLGNQTRERGADKKQAKSGFLEGV